MPTGILRGRDTESFLSIDVTGSTGRTLTSVEFTARTIRFEGTLGESVLFRLPLSSTEDKGRTYTIENQTLGGYTIEIAALSGGSVEILAGAGLTCYYDGADIVGQAAASAAAIPAIIGDAVSYVPIVITDPQVGDAITYVAGDPGEFVNTPPGTATVNMGSAIAGGTVGSVIFVATGPVLAQDNSNFFWADSTNRLGIGTNAPNAPLHVLNNSATTLATFAGSGPFASVFFQMGDGSQTAAVRVYPGIAASGGGPLISNGGVILRAHYWSGAASLPADGWMRMDMAATTPRYHLALGCGSTDNFWMRQDGQLTIGATTPFNNGTVTQEVVLAGQVFINTDVTLNGLVNWVFPESNGPVWGTDPAQTQAWWGATPVARSDSPTGTDSQKIDGLIAILEDYGLLGL